jgi:hypothetical protein
MGKWKNCKIGNTTATLLLEEVKVHGVPTDIEEINSLADVIGNMTIQQLEQAFDMNRDLTLFILKSVWNIQDVINFYNNRLGYQPKSVTESQIETAKNIYETRIDRLVQEHNDIIQVKDHTIAQYELNIQEYIRERNEREDELARTLDEIVRLKALLWDMSQTR